MEKILLLEGSSLTARETLTVLKNSGYQIDVLSSVHFPITAFSKWRHKIIKVVNVNSDPIKYLHQVVKFVKSGQYMSILPTHEEIWLLAEAIQLLPKDMPIAIASVTSFRELQGKIAFAELGKKLGLVVPEWQVLTEDNNIPFSYSYWIKGEYGTAGRSVYKVHSDKEKICAIQHLSSCGRLMAQEHVSGTYGQVQAVFEHGNMQAVHTSLQTGLGAGGSAAARLSVDIPQAREDIGTIGNYLSWHGCLTIDFILHKDTAYYIECNPRMVEPANAYASGVNFPQMLINLSVNKQYPSSLLIGKSGIKTHSTMALLFGTAEQTKSREKIIKLAWESLVKSKFLADSKEVLTPVSNDFLSLFPLLASIISILIYPNSVKKIISHSVKNYSVDYKTISYLNNDLHLAE